jgi:ABC-type bacteriocin/lantibiotic exporter with double-glycine peptidase domain
VIRSNQENKKHQEISRQIRRHFERRSPPLRVVQVQNKLCPRKNAPSRLFNIIESIIVIKSFVREETEREKQRLLQQNLIDAQIRQRKTNYAFDAMKTFIEQVGVVLIIILTAYLVLDGQMTLGAIMFHILLFNNVSAPIRQLHRIYDEINEAMTYAEGTPKAFLKCWTRTTQSKNQAQSERKICAASLN